MDQPRRGAPSRLESRKKSSEDREATEANKIHTNSRRRGKGTKVSHTQRDSADCIAQLARFRCASLLAASSTVKLLLLVLRCCFASCALTSASNRTSGRVAAALAGTAAAAVAIVQLSASTMAAATAPAALIACRLIAGCCGCWRAVVAARFGRVATRGGGPNAT